MFDKYSVFVIFRDKYSVSVLVFNEKINRKMQRDNLYRYSVKFKATFSGLF